MQQRDESCRMEIWKFFCDSGGAFGERGNDWPADHAGRIQYFQCVKNLDGVTLLVSPKMNKRSNLRKSFPPALRLLYLFNKRQRASRLNGDGFGVNRDRFRDRVSNDLSPGVDSGPIGFAATRIALRPQAPRFHRGRRLLAYHRMAPVLLRHRDGPR